MAPPQPPARRVVAPRSSSKLTQPRNGQVGGSRTSDLTAHAVESLAYGSHFVGPHISDSTVQQLSQRIPFTLA
uniref:Uncharacterized protein n=1 Tax=Oryza glumipatula TaxID=40148 RepID=A0A0E0A6J7_9ORYZ